MGGGGYMVRSSEPLSEKEWVGGTELGLPDPPPLPLASKNSPGPIPRKHHWLLLSASEVHGYLEENNMWYWYMYNLIQA